MRFVCIASGPSLTREDVEAARGKAEVIVVNDCWRLAPWADHLYAADHAWWNYHGAAVLAGFHGRRWTQQPIAKPRKEQKDVIERFRLMPVGGKWERGLGIDCIHYPDVHGNGGYQAINLAFLLGATEIVLLGYDMKRDGDQIKGRSHWFGEHPKQINCSPDYLACAGVFPELAAALKERGVDVINCTRETALTCFPRKPLSEALREPKAAHCAG